MAEVEQAQPFPGFFRQDDCSLGFVPEPLVSVEFAGTGYSVVHCHILPHNDEGCVMNFQLLNST